MAAFKATDNTIVLVTGINNTGVGFAIAQALLTTPSHTKYTMILTARSLDRSKNAVELLKKGEGAEAALGVGGCEVVPMQVDIDDEESVEAFKHGLSERFGRLDVLINNAGMRLLPVCVPGDLYCSIGAHHDFALAAGKMTTREAFVSAFNTNVASTHLFTYSLIHFLLASSSPRIIFITSGISSLGDHSNPHVPVNGSPAAGWPKPYVFNVMTYRTSKTAMNMMILEWCRILKKDGVKIHIVDPGFLATTLGGGDAAMSREKGAEEPIVGGRFIASVVEGKRDEDVGRMMSRTGVLPW